MKILSDNSESREYWEGWHDDPCDDLPNCICGGSARKVNEHRLPTIHHVYVLQCESPNCERTAVGSTWAEAAEDWSDGVKRDSCVKHGWIATVDPSIWKCPHCGCEQHFRGGKFI